MVDDSAERPFDEPVTLGPLIITIPEGFRVFRADGSEVHSGDVVTASDGDFTVRCPPGDTRIISVSFTQAKH